MSRRRPGPDDWQFHVERGPCPRCGRDVGWFWYRGNSGLFDGELSNDPEGRVHWKIHRCPFGAGILEDASEH